MDIPSLIKSANISKIIEWAHRPGTSRPDREYGLSIAASLGFTYIVYVLNREGASVSTRDNLPLLYAVHGGYSETVDYLLLKGANPNARNGQIMDYATKTQIIDILVAHGGRMTQKSKMSIYFRFIQENDLQSLKDFLENYYYSADDYNELLQMCIEENKLLIFKYLYGLNPRMLNPKIYYAATINDNYDIIEILVEHPAFKQFIYNVYIDNDISMFSYYLSYMDDQTLIEYLQKAINDNKLDFVQSILIENKERNLALDNIIFQVVSDGLTSIVKLMHKYGVNLHIQNDRVIDIAIHNQNFPMADLLWFYGIGHNNPYIIQQLSKLALDNNIHPDDLKYK